MTGRTPGQRPGPRPSRGRRSCPGRGRRGAGSAHRRAGRPSTTRCRGWLAEMGGAPRTGADGRTCVIEDATPAGRTIARSHRLGDPRVGRGRLQGRAHHRTTEGQRRARRGSAVQKPQRAAPVLRVSARASGSSVHVRRWEDHARWLILPRVGGATCALCLWHWSAAQVLPRRACTSS